MPRYLVDLPSREGDFLGVLAEGAASAVVPEPTISSSRRSTGSTCAANASMNADQQMVRSGRWIVPGQISGILGLSLKKYVFISVLGLGSCLKI